MLTLIFDLYHAVDIFYNYAIPYELKNYSKCKMHQTVYSYIAFGQINRIFLLTPIHCGIFKFRLQDVPPKSCHSRLYVSATLSTIGTYQ